MSSSRDKPIAPPRLLLGALLLFWGAMVREPIVGLVLAFLVEGRAWVRLRWKFAEHAYVRAWWLSLLLLTLALTWEWVGGSNYMSLFAVLRWLPVLFLPLIFVQQYGLRPGFPLNTFSMVARRKMLQDRKEGREVDPVLVHFGYIYFGLTLIASAFGRGADREPYFIGLMVFAGQGLFFAFRGGRQRPVAWVVSLLLAAVIGYAGSLGLWKLTEYLEDGRFSLRGRAAVNAGSSITHIGKVGELKLSDEIYWRVRVEKGGVPRLLRDAVYNNYSGGIWGYTPPAGRTKRQDEDEMSQRGDEEHRFVFDRRDYDIDDDNAPRVTITGSVNTRSYRSVLPLPAGARLLDRLRVGGVSFTSLGTTRAENPESSVLRFDVYHQRGTRNEEDPYDRFDLVVPRSDEEAISKAVDELGLRGLPQREVLARIRQFFADEFQYALFSELPDWMDNNPVEAMRYFLEEGKRGHCEYFATAAVLMLREAGIPARYVTGFAAKEQANSGEWLLRGQHGHAWCRVYLGGEPAVDVIEDPEEGTREEFPMREGGEWIDFDPTPGNWLAVEGSGISWEQRILDGWQRFRQEVLLWRTQEGIRTRVTWGTSIAGVLLLAYIVIRLWKSQVVAHKQGAGEAATGRIDRSSPLAKLIKPAEKLLGARATGQPFTRWLSGLAEFRPGLAGSLDRISQLYWKDRFDSLGLEPEEEEQLRVLCRKIRRGL